MEVSLKPGAGSTEHFGLLTIKTHVAGADEVTVPVVVEGNKPQ